MTEFLSAEWFARLETAAQQLPVVEGASAEIVVNITKAPGGDVEVKLLIEDGRLASADLGGGAEAPVAVTCPFDLAAAIVRGEASVSVAFMRGDLKVNGDMGVMHRVLPLTDDQPFIDALDGLAATTAF